MYLKVHQKETELMRLSVVLIKFVKEKKKKIYPTFRGFFPDLSDLSNQQSSKHADNYFTCLTLSKKNG